MTDSHDLSKSSLKNTILSYTCFDLLFSFLLYNNCILVQQTDLQGWKICIFPRNVVAFPTISYVFLHLKYLISHQIVKCPWKELPDFHLFPPCLYCKLAFEFSLLQGPSKSHFEIGNNLSSCPRTLSSPWTLSTTIWGLLVVIDWSLSVADVQPIAVYAYIRLWIFLLSIILQ